MNRRKQKKKQELPAEVREHFLEKILGVPTPSDELMRRITKPLFTFSDEEREQIQKELKELEEQEKE